MKKLVYLLMSVAVMTGFVACSDDDNNETVEQEPTTKTELAERDLTRAMALLDTVVVNYFSGSTMTIAEKYNPYTKTASSETGSIWQYTSALEAVNSVLEALEAIKSTNSALYNANHDRYVELLAQLYENMEYYAGTYTLISYTQTKEWTVYAVDRSGEAGKANVEGANNVYDDQEWLIRELVRSYKVTGNQAYLDKAEYLTSYVLDGWDCTMYSGAEIGGITWGPSYTTKHACSNGPLVSPLVWLHEIYSGKAGSIEYRHINARKVRLSEQMTKDEYYIMFARKIYEWQKKYMLNDDGVYYDLVGSASGDVQYETVSKVKYRRGSNITGASGKSYTYNAGAMLSGASDLYKSLQEETFATDAVALNDASFNLFATPFNRCEGCYTYPIDGFSPWFNDVLLRGFIDARNYCSTDSKAADSYQANLDYSWKTHLYHGMLPINIVVGWSQTKANNGEYGLFAFGNASMYAMLAKYQIAQ